jgi:hypothetical protein
LVWFGLYNIKEFSANISYYDCLNSIKLGLTVRFLVMLVSGKHLGSKVMLLVGQIWVQPAPKNVTPSKIVLSAKMASTVMVCPDSDWAMKNLITKGRGAFF